MAEEEATAQIEGEAPSEFGGNAAGNQLWAADDEFPGVNLYLNGHVFDRQVFWLPATAFWCMIIPINCVTWADSQWGATTAQADGYKVSMSFYRTKVDAFEGNVEAACVGSAEHGGVVCAGIKYIGNADEETDGQVWGWYIDYPTFTASQSMMQGVATDTWFNMGSATLPNTSGQDFSVGRFQVKKRTPWLSNKEKHKAINHDFRIDTECADCEAWYYTHVTDGVEAEETIVSKGSFVFTGAIATTISAAALSIAVTLAF